MTGGKHSSAVSQTRKTKAPGATILKSIPPPPRPRCNAHAHLCVSIPLGPLPFATPPGDNSAGPKRLSSEPSPWEPFPNPLNSLNIYFLATYYVPKTMPATWTALQPTRAQVCLSCCTPRRPRGRGHISSPTDTSVYTCAFVHAWDQFEYAIRYPSFLLYSSKFSHM